MAVAQSIVATSGTATRIGPTVDGTWTSATLVLQNLSTTSTDLIYIGSSAVTTTAYGYVLHAGTATSKNSLTIAITPQDNLYVVSNATPNLAVLTLYTTFTKQVPA